MAVLSRRRPIAKSRWLGGASLAFGALLAMQPVAGASATTYGQADPAVQAGQAVIMKANCGGCHIIPGIPRASGNLGPNLGSTDSLPPVSERAMIAPFPTGPVPNNSPEDVAAWIQDPPSLKPGTAMPRLGLSADDAAAAAAYLYAIQPDGSVAGLVDSGSGETGSEGMGSGG